MTNQLAGLPSWIAAAAVLAGALALGPVAAQEPRAPLTAESVRQKADLLTNLVTRSVSAATIEAGEDAEAKAALAAARELVAAGKRALADGDAAGADAKLNEALRIVNVQTRRLSAERVRDERLHEVYERQLKSVRTLLQAYGRVAAEKGAASAAERQREQLTRMIAEAEAHSAQGRIAEAKAVLDRAYRTTTGELRGLRQGDTLVRSLAFASPRDEYDYEIDRNESHFMLLRIATDDAGPAAPVRPQVAAMRTEAVELRASAERQSAAGDYRAAIGLLEQSTAVLLRAIRMSGLYIPG